MRRDLIDLRDFDLSDCTCGLPKRLASIRPIVLHVLTAEGAGLWMMAPQGHLLGPWVLLPLLLLLLLPSVVVSTEPKKQAANEAIGSAEKGAPAIQGASLIARPERGPEAAADYRALQRRLQRSLRLELFPVALHQQSTNAAAAKRDLHYKQQGRPARGTGADSRTIQQGKKYQNKKRLSSLAGQINELKSGAEEEADRRIGRRDNPQPLRIIYADAAPPEPFAQPTQKERARPFSLANFFGKNRSPLEPRTIRPSSKPKSLTIKSTFTTEKDVAEKIKQKKASVGAPPTTTEMITTTETTTTAEMTTTELPETTEMSPIMKINETEESNKNFALYYKIIDKDLENAAATVPNLEENSIVVETDSFLTGTPSTNSDAQNSYRADWDASESLTKEIIEEVAVNEEPKRRRQAARVTNLAAQPEETTKKDEKYEFGYRVIDRDSGSEFGHAESRQGRMTSGQYHVRLPDGRVQRVRYVVDRIGYHAVVTYERDGTTSPSPTSTRTPVRRRPRRRHS